MNLKPITYCLLFAFIAFLNSCSIEKRTFNKGYFVQWNNQKIDSKHKNQEIKSTVEKQDLSIINSLEKKIISEKVENIDLSSANINNNIPSQIANRKSTRKNSKSFIVNSLSEENVKSKTIAHSIKQVRKIENKIKQKRDGELVINIVLTVVFLAAAIIFTMMGLAAIPPMQYVWLGIALLSFILFVTQVIDLIQS
jgi:uncharacterized protein YjaZ